MQNGYASKRKLVDGANILRSLDELEDDLLLELNQVAHDNQLAYLPFARSGRAEALLFDRYPELAERIERGRRAKIDAIVLSNKYADGDSLSTSFRAQSLEEATTSPLRQRTRRRASKETKSPALTPALKGKSSVQDLMFEMSDGGDDDDIDLHSKIKQPRFTDHDVDENQANTPLGSPEAPWATHSKQIRSSLLGFDTGEDIPLNSVSPLPPPAVQAARPSGQPWGAAPLSSAKLDLKNIMAQTSPSTPSNLTLGFSRKEIDQKASLSHAKMSQKERKRLQQVQQLGTPVEKPQPIPPAVSPWQATSHRKPSNSPAIVPEPQPSPKPSPQPSQAPSTPHLTMRQTIANNGAGAKQKGRRASEQALQGASGGDSPSRPRPAANERGMSVSTDPIPTPRSVRHIPLPQHSPTSPSQNMSMMEILSLQEAEKVSIRDAAAKRSLQEIQQEQEFQAWWDEESKRVIQEEEQRRRAEERAARAATRGRGKGRGGRGGKGRGKIDGEIEDDRGKGSRDVSQSPAIAESASLKIAPKHDSADGGRGRGRGHRGGRGGVRGARLTRPPRGGQSAPQT